MKIMSWNIQNGGAVFSKKDEEQGKGKPIPSNIDNILDTIRKENPDILILQEFQYQYKDRLIENGLKKDGYQDFRYYEEYLNKEHDGANGVLICNKIGQWKELPKPVDIYKYTYRNWCEVELTDNNLRLLAVDVPLVEKRDGVEDIRKRKAFLEDGLKHKFLEYRNMEGPAVILGDFNLFIMADGETSTFSEYLTFFENTLVSLVKGITWGNHQNDYIFGNAAFVNMVQPGHEKPVQTSYSDHNYLIVEIA